MNTNGLQLGTKENFRKSCLEKKPKPAFVQLHVYAKKKQREPQEAKNRLAEARCCRRE